MCVVVLNESLTSHIPDLRLLTVYFYFLVVASSSHTGAIWVEANRVHHSCVVGERIDETFLREIPELDGAVIRA